MQRGCEDKVKTILKCKFGSHLYGTNTKDSDEDYKGIALPDSRDILLGNIFKTKKDDLDYDIYSLHYFIKLACEGETAAIDMLHVPENMILETSDEWKFIQAYREKFYTKNMKAFFGYARRQAAKYGCRGSRLASITELIKLLEDPYFLPRKMEDAWGCLPLGEHAKMIENSPNGAKQYQVCGRILQSTARVEYCLYQLRDFHNKYGERSKLAEKNEGIDWKAIKQGKWDYRTQAEPYLESLMNEVEQLGIMSTLPDKSDIEFWNNFLIETCKKEIIKN